MNKKSAYQLANCKNATATRFDNPPPQEVIRILGKSVKCLHLNDNDTFTDQHKIPGTGTIDWDKTFDTLDEINYNGIYNMELILSHFGKGFEIETAEFAIKVMRFMLEKRYKKYYSRLYLILKKDNRR